MKLLITTVITLSIAMTASCDMRSGTAKEEMDKFSGTPTPTITPKPTPTPIDPADVVQVDTSMDGETLTVNGDKPIRTAACKKFDMVMVNVNESVVNISGVCSRVTINGDGNQITADAAAEFVFNGSDNTLKFARFVNGKQPVVTDNRSGNDVEKIPFDTQKNTGSKNKSGK